MRVSSADGFDVAHPPSMAERRVKPVCGSIRPLILTVKQKHPSIDTKSQAPSGEKDYGKNQPPKGKKEWGPAIESTHPARKKAPQVKKTIKKGATKKRAAKRANKEIAPSSASQ